VSFLAISFTIGAININSQNTNSTASIGKNQQSGWTANRKTNSGVGQQIGIFANTANNTVILDNDVKDGNMIDKNNIPSTQGQGL
jgi:hypothetical protein